MSGANEFHIVTEKEFIFRNGLLKRPVLYLQIPFTFLLLIYSKGELRAGSKCKTSRSCLRWGRPCNCALCVRTLTFCLSLEWGVGKEKALC